MKKFLLILSLAVVTAIGTAGTAAIEVCTCTFLIKDGNGNLVNDAIVVANGVVHTAMNGKTDFTFETGTVVKVVAYKEGYDTASMEFTVVAVGITEKTIVLNQSDQPTT